ncbi:hypothetical protein OHT77_37345 [Streptomyces sp. NBC_00252]|uniref:hypothetical protein n=1 Tax=Streptomyces sp. NBC_00252 TaxID=2975691 RepID=UPI002E29E2C1|nr:hypothetical protein [Streptomyces sp. NBC_00252]
MLHTVRRRRAGGESVEQIQTDLFIPTGKRRGLSPSVAGIHRALAEHALRWDGSAQKDFERLRSASLAARPPR